MTFYKVDPKGNYNQYRIKRYLKALSINGLVIARIQAYCYKDIVRYFCLSSMVVYLR